MKLFYFSRTHVNVMRAVWFSAGLAVSAGLSYAVKEPPKYPIIDKKMEKACGMWPRYEGEILTVLVVEKRLRCWQMGYNRQPGE